MYCYLNTVCWILYLSSLSCIRASGEGVRACTGSRSTSSRRSHGVRAFNASSSCSHGVRRPVVYGPCCSSVRACTVVARPGGQSMLLSVRACSSRRSHGVRADARMGCVVRDVCRVCRCLESRPRSRVESQNARSWRVGGETSGPWCAGRKGLRSNVWSGSTKTPGRCKQQWRFVAKQSDGNSPKAGVPKHQG